MECGVVMKYYVKMVGFLVMFLTSVSFFGFTHGESDDKILKTLFPTATKFVSKGVELSSQRIKEIEKELGISIPKDDLNAKAIVAVDGKKGSIGLIWRTHVEASKGGVFDCWVAVDVKGRVARVLLSGQLPDPKLKGAAFLKQFVGKSHEAPLQIGRDLKGISSNLKELENIAIAVKRSLFILDHLIPHSNH